jgi:peptidyl-prolyl cis-trans isomerase C
VLRACLTCVALLFLSACSKTGTPAATATPGATTAATPGAATPASGTPLPAGATLTPPGPPPAKPVPAQLPAVVATINGENVTSADLEAAVKNLEAQAGGPVPADQRDRIYRDLLDRLVGYKLLSQEVKARSLVVEDAEVDARVAEIRKQFPTEPAFSQMLQQRQMTLEKLRADTRQDVAVAKLIENAIADKIGVTPDQVQTFYAQNPGRFQQPDRVRASHILLSFPQNADAAAKAQVRTKAEQVLKEVKSSKDFAALAKRYSQDPGSAANGGDLGFFPQGQMVGPFGDVAFSLAPGATSELVETQFGYHIIRVVEKQAARAVPLEEVRAQVVQFLQDQNRQQQTEAFVGGLKSKGTIAILM